MRNKVYYLVVLLFSVGILVSCSSDDDSGHAGNTDLIVGKWMLYQDGDMNGGTEILQLWEHDCDTKKDFWEFKSNGEVTENYYDIYCDLETSFGQYTIEGDTIKLTTTYGDTTFTINGQIQVLDENNLKIKIEETFGTINYVYIYVFKRM